MREFGGAFTGAGIGTLSIPILSLEGQDVLRAILFGFGGGVLCCGMLLLVFSRKNS